MTRSKLNSALLLVIYLLKSFKVFHCSVINVLCCVLCAVRFAISLIIIARGAEVVNNLFQFFLIFFKLKFTLQYLVGEFIKNAIYSSFCIFEYVL